MLVHSLIAVAVMMAAESIVEAEALPPGLKMHRLQAGEIDASGWVLARSTEGGFTVKLPMKFNDFTAEEHDPEALASRSYVIGMKSTEAIRFSAARIVYKQGADAAREIFTRMERGKDLKTPPRGISKRRFGGRRAVDTVRTRTEAIAWRRAVLLEHDLVVMIVEAPREHAALAQQLATPFFDSLVIGEI